MAAQFHGIRAIWLPTKGNPGDAYFVTDTKTFYIAIGDGTLVDLASLLQPRAPLAVGPQGHPGRAGRDAVDGKPGRDVPMDRTVGTA